MPFPPRLLRGLAWVLAVSLFLVALTLLARGSVLSAFAVAGLGLLFLPPVLERSRRLLGRDVPVGERVLVAFVLLVSLAFAANTDRERHEARVEAARVEQLAVAYGAERDSVLGRFEARIAGGEAELGIAETRRYAEVADDSLIRLTNIARAAIREHETDSIETELLAELGGVPASRSHRNLVLYRELVELRPTNMRYRERVRHYETQLAQDRARERAEQEAEKKREAERRTRALAQMRVEQDEMRGVNFYTDPASPRLLNSRTTLYYYIAHIPGSQPRLRMKLISTSGSWVFWRRAYVKVDEQVFRFDFGHFDVERDHAYGDVWEWVDVAARGDYLNAAVAIRDSGGPVKLRFEGEQYYRERTLGRGDVAAIGRVLYAFDALAADPSHRP